MQNLNNMLIFAKVAELGGISSAARALHMPKSTVSRRLSQLESELGIRLLQRTTRAVHLTEAGRIYFQHCRRVAEEVHNASASVSSMLEKPRGILRIGASVTMGQQLVAPLIGEFINRYPDVQIELNLTNRRVDLIAEGYDMVIRVGHLDDSSLISKHLGSAFGKLYASPDYLQQQGVPVEVTDLLSHRLLIMSDTISPHQWTLVNSDNHQETIAFQAFATVNDFAVIKRLAVDGVGIAKMPDYLAVNELRQGLLQEVLTDWRTPAFSYYAVYPSRRGVPLKVRAWLDFLLEKL